MAIESAESIVRSHDLTAIDIERFWAKVDRREPDECWPWRGATNGNGYGRMSVGGRRGRKCGAHQVSWMIANNAAVPVGMDIMHACDNRPCCNPAHLHAGTRSENIYDMYAKGRQAQRATASLAALKCARDERRAPKLKLTESDVRAIRRRLAAGESQRRIARDFGVYQSAISKINRRERWSHLNNEDPPVGFNVG